MDSSCNSSASTACTSTDRSVSSLIDQACELNEDGVFELSSGRSVEALKYFQEAQELLLEVMHTSSCSSTTDNVSLPLTGRVQIPYVQDDLFYIYSCAVSYYFHGTSAAHAAGRASAASLTFQHAMVLFNMSLAYHQLAAHKLSSATTGSRDALKQALSCYKDCQQALQTLLHSSTSTAAEEEEDDLILLTLAVLNNQAQIEYHLSTCMDASCSTPQTSSFQELWQYSMHYALRIHQQETNFSMVEQSQIQEFVQNAMLLRLQRSCVAPTA